MVEIKRIQEVARMERERLVKLEDVRSFLMLARILMKMRVILTRLSNLLA